MAESEEKLMIIAMKGHPGTGKSTIAHALASLLKIPLIDKDDIKDFFSPFSSNPNPNPNSTLLNDLSYDVVFRLASTQLRLGLSVVIDSPLSRRSHVDRLIGLASSAGARLLIVHCRPSDKAEWRRRLETRQPSWHKPSTWQDIERLLEAYGGCTDFDVGDVAKVVVDTTAAVSFDEIVSTVVDFVKSHGVASQN